MRIAATPSSCSLLCPEHVGERPVDEDGAHVGHHACPHHLNLVRRRPTRRLHLHPAPYEEINPHPTQGQKSYIQKQV